MNGGDNSIQDYGSEASGSELAAAAKALHDYLDARAAGAWGAACGYLDPAIIEELGRAAKGEGGGKPGCATVLAELTAAVPARVLREAAQVDVGALRLEGERGFLLFDGAHGSCFMPMTREGGSWRVAAIAASPLS